MNSKKQLNIIIIIFTVIVSIAFLIPMSLIVSNAYAINIKPQPINYQEENYYTKPIYIQEGYISLKA